jgi:hypothetical protein
MDKNNVSRIIIDQASQNITLYPDSYPIEGDRLSYEGTLNLLSLAQSYWDTRNETEIQRDDTLNITLEDYVNWVGEAFRRINEETLEQIRAAAKHFLELYQEEINAKEVTEDAIYEWWHHTKENYPEADYENVETLILSELHPS